MQLEANLQDLSLCQFEIEIECTGLELAQIFEQYPLLPGAVLVEQATFVGMISRRRLLEYLLHPYGLELFLKQSLRVLHSYARREMLLLSGETPILSAAQQALRRSPDLQDEPVVVQVTPKSYYLLDIHALNIASWQIRGIETQVRYERTQVEMIQSDKMANLGRLVDGIAHEILDPVSFIWGNLSHVSSYCNDLLALLSLYEMAMPSPPMAILHRREELEIDYLRKDLPQTIKSIRAGAERLSKLATSLQNFCHVDEVYPKPANLHEMLDSILLLLQSRLSSEICFVKNYGQLPPVPCFAGQLNQVFMNILSMAVDTLLSQAISQELESDLKTREPATIAPYPKFQPTITITTQVCSLPSSDRESRWISICIANNGLSLSAEMQQQIRESFSIKRRALKETSLTVSYQIITAKHGGKFEIRSPRSSASAQVATAIDEGGTEFEILLPLI
jgi:hypothetical protein